ncbi:hypothetical protein FOVG_16669 [Fusarium oxysporum f. sp. pisi HDV247]|uniref:VOC domain-containing protein n=1 Tax=Fusarium oxysporum f. sp. pisi HDV247 TaxID=1080344 RepID=W9NQ21_FUSOX|nr:hypothetical protein FOVG_16669 [Fusarium oxysporum f. sp. pisi HDV247]
MPQLIPTYNAPSNKVLKPAHLAHVVLRTGNLEKMEKFYLQFLGGSVTYANEMISFITYDDEHHRIALIGIPGTAAKVPDSCGLEHIAFSFSSLADLLHAYSQRKSHGIDAVWFVNHGPTTSIYYKDPDGNMLETQVDNFDTVEEATAFMMSDKFAENPIGTDFNPEELIAAINDGVSEKALMKRREIGPRGLSDVGAM